MATVVLEAKNRESLGTGSARSDRRNGFVPCIVYGDNAAPESIRISKDLLSRYVYKSNFFSTVFEINGIGKKGQKFIAKAAQIHPVTDQVIHVDFMRVGKGSKVNKRNANSRAHAEFFKSRKPRNFFSVARKARRNLL